MFSISFSCHLPLPNNLVRKLSSFFSSVTRAAGTTPEPNSTALETLPTLNLSLTSKLPVYSVKLFLRWGLSITTLFQYSTLLILFNLNSVQSGVMSMQSGKIWGCNTLISHGTTTASLLYIHLSAPSILRCDCFWHWGVYFTLFFVILKTQWFGSTSFC